MPSVRSFFRTAALCAVAIAPLVAASAGMLSATAASASELNGSSRAANMADQPMSIIRVSPNVGRAAGRDTVTITGSGFDDTITHVVFGNSVTRSIKVLNSTHVQVVTPVMTPGTLAVTIYSDNGKAVLPAGYTASQKEPTITNISSVSGPAKGGAEVAIDGSGFLGSNPQVLFGDALATSVAVMDDTHMVVKTPAHAAGLVHIEAKTSNGVATAPTEYLFE